MRAVTALAVGVASAGALTVSWIEGLRPVVASSVAVGRGRPSPEEQPAAAVPTTSAPRSHPGKAATAPAAVPHVVQGPSIQTQYGSVQVAVDYKGTRITDVVALHLTDSSGTSVAISASALRSCAGRRSPPSRRTSTS